MKKNIPISLTLGLLYFICGCNNNTVQNEYYIISKDTINIYLDCVKRQDSTCLAKMPPLPSMPPSMEWYSNLVILFDSTDKVYLYQTEYIDNYDSAKNHNPERNYSLYPIYIGLQPFHLMTFESGNFISFIKSNDDILKLDTIFSKNNRFIYIASNKDTIKNKAFYDLLELIKPKSEIRKKNQRVYYIIRNTTEEENNVIFCKRNDLPNIPNDTKWSANFISGNCHPFTKEYNDLENQMFFKIKARELFIKDCTKLLQIK
jgi:hypothetical protein